MTDSPATVLIVDDESSIRKLLRRCFESEHYRVHEAANSVELFSILESGSVDLIMLDLNLGDENGLDLARQIRNSSDVGIIVVSGKGELIDTVVGLEMGADDYISKPFELLEVLARARSVLRRTRISAEEKSATLTPVKKTEFQFENLILTPSKRSLVGYDGDECDLTSAEYDLLEVLVRNSGIVMSRSQIMDKLKGHDWNPNDRTIDNQVARLRKKIDPEGRLQAIKSVRGVGYLFTLDVS